MSLDMALRLAAAGYHLAPVTIRRDPATGKKRPDYHGMSWDAAATTDPEQLVRWSRQFGSACGFLVATEPSGIVVVDLDVKGDALGWWAAEGLPCSTLLVDTPSGGQHQWWRMPAGMAIPNSAGAIAPGVDVRGIGGHVFAPGTRVVGDTEPYRALDPIVPPRELPELPDEIVKRIPTGRRAPRERGPAAASRTTHDEPWVIREGLRQLDLVAGAPAAPGSGFRLVLMGAALVLGRAVAAGIADRAYAEERLCAAVTSCWGAVDAEDREWIAVGLDDGEADPWTVLPPAVEDNALSSAAEVPEPQADPDGYALALELEVRRLRLRQDAAQRLAAENREPLEVLDLDAFLDAPQPDYLVPGAVYRNGTAKVFGPPGGTKSFFLLDLALCVAAGAPWHGHDVEPATVHYVMAEGQAVNTSRALAWFHHRGLDRAAARGRYFAIPRGVLLTEQGIAKYLERVRQDRPALVILDTKNRMMVGEENSASDVAVMVRAMDAIRHVGGGTSVVLVDHTGVHDTTRGRGSNAVEGAMDTEIRVTRDEGGTARAEVTRDKAAEVGRSWEYRLRRIENVPGIRPDVPIPAVLVPVEDAVPAPFANVGQWWTDPTEVPEELVEMKMPARKGKSTMLAIFRLLRWIGDDDEGGVTAAEIRQMLAEGGVEPSRSEVSAALVAMRKANVTEQGRTAEKIKLSARFA